MPVPVVQSAGLVKLCAVKYWAMCLPDRIVLGVAKSCFLGPTHCVISWQITTISQLLLLLHFALIDMLLLGYVALRVYSRQ